MNRKSNTVTIHSIQQVEVCTDIGLSLLLDDKESTKKFWSRYATECGCCGQKQENS